MPEPLQTLRPKTAKKTRLVGLGMMVVILAALISGLIILVSGGKSAANNPVPPTIRRKLAFPVYFPDPAKEPVGYRVNRSSFSAGGGALLYEVDGPKQLKLSISEQSKPSAADLSYFVSSRIPINTPYQTSVGTATIGAIGNNSVISLPTNSKTWLIISAPYNINASQLDQFLRSLTD